MKISVMVEYIHKKHNPAKVLAVRISELRRTNT